jgi:non-ribosomal peptide synthetase component E (peptide arylation enzyme)
MRVVDITDPTREMPVGERGELMFRGPLVMLGYYGSSSPRRDHDDARATPTNHPVHNDSLRYAPCPAY